MSCAFLLAIPTSVAVERGESTEVVGSMRRHRIAPKTLFSLLRYAVQQVAVPLSFSVSCTQPYLTFASRYISVPAYLSFSCFELNNSDFLLFFSRVETFNVQCIEMEVKSTFVLLLRLYHDCFATPFAKRYAREYR